MMLRWGFMFLMLANAVLLLWYSGFQHSPKSTTESLQDPSVQTLRLVSELDERLVAAKGAKKLPVTECVVFRGFTTEVSATAVVEFVVEQGFDAEVGKENRVVVADYSLNIATPTALEKSMLLLDELEGRGWKVAEDDILAGGSIRGGLFSTRAEAEEVAQALIAQKYRADIVANKRTEIRYMVTVFQSSDRNLSKEIKEVVLESYSDIKITKKVCSGVARDRRTE